ncbi:exosome complex component RRP43-like [Colias croceus]|uniref:exosome complex component RRP43-like n=1 Tax=Colias crocea TaxID=72248 RepID=UPI001E27D8D3|nr:exosome complex component RRP43-like [Colias croceus]
MTDIYKLIHPNKYFDDYISRNVRPDGRKFDEQRSIKLNLYAIKTSEASAVVKCGNTTVICGITLELATPKAEEPDNGFLVTNVELLPLCSSKFRPGPPSDHAQVVSNTVNDILINSKCIDLKDLCIVSDKLAWVLYCDMVCLDNDGSVVDACLTTLMASLKTLSLPTVNYDVETEDIKVDPSIRKPLKVTGLPVATSFAIYQTPQSNIVLTDPTAYEEEMCGGIGANLIVCWNQGLLCGVQKFGGGNITTEKHKDMLKVAKERSKIIEKVIDTCLNDDSNK